MNPFCVDHRAVDDGVCPSCGLLITDGRYADAVISEAAVTRESSELHWAIPVLIEALTDRRSHIRCLAVGALGELGAPAAQSAQSIAGLLNDTDRRVQCHAMWALPQVSPEWGLCTAATTARRLSDPSVWCWFLKLVVSRGPGAKACVSELVGALESTFESRETKYVIISALGAIGPEASSAVPSLLRVAELADDALAVNIIEALSRIGYISDRTTTMLDAVAGSQSSAARVHAAFVRWLIDRQLDRTLRVLVDALADKDPGTRLLAAQCLARMGGLAADALPALRRALQPPPKRLFGNQALSERKARSYVKEAISAIESGRDVDSSCLPLVP